MYKEIVVCILVIVLIISIDLISNNYTKKIFSEINGDLEILRNQMLDDNKDKNNIQNQLKKINAKWNENLNILSCYIEHNELEKVARQITVIKGNADIEEYGQAIPQLDECVYIINHIVDKERVLIRNLF